MEFAVPGVGPGRVEIIDVGGRLVRSLELPAAREDRAALVWDGKDQAGRSVGSGLYLLRVVRGGENRVTRIVRVQ